MDEFINFHQGGMSAQDYSLKFTKLFKYALSFVSNPRDEISRFVMEVSDDLVEWFHLVMLYDNMDISHLMVHAQQVEETRLIRKAKDVKRAKSYKGGYFKGRLDIQDKPKFKKMFSNQVPSKFPKSCDDRVSNPQSSKGRGINSLNEKSTCTKCCKKHMVECLVGAGNIEHKVRDCSHVRGQEKGSAQAQATGSNSNVPRKNCFYTLHSRVKKRFLPMW